MKKAVSVIAVLLSIFIVMSCKENGVSTTANHVTVSVSVSAGLEPGHKWREQDGVIYLSVTSNGKTGEEWIKYLEDKKINMADYTKATLRSKDFKPTSGVTTNIAVLKGVLFADDVRITSNILSEAEHRKLTKPNAEIACLIRDKFTDKEIEAMGLLGIVVMHEPIKINYGSYGAPYLLGAGLRVSVYSLGAFRGNLGLRWLREDGFAFSTEQIFSL